MAGIGRAGVTTMFGAMNIAPPLKEDHYEEIDRTLLPCIKKFQDESMQAAIAKHFCKEEIACFCFILCYFLLDDAVDENDGNRTVLTVLWRWNMAKTWFQEYSWSSSYLIIQYNTEST